MASCDAKEAESETPPKATKPVPPPPPPKQDREPSPEPAAPAKPLPKTHASLPAAIEAAQTLWADARRSFLCGCPFRADGRVNHAGCGYAARADDEAAKRIAWTHLVPPLEFGGDRKCWMASGCKDAEGKSATGVQCCVATDPEFVAMYTDLHNLVPMIEEVANDRAGARFGEIDGEDRLYGRCDFEVDTEQGVAEPPPARRGDVARAYLYMDATYPGALSLSPLERRRLATWAAEDPPDESERARAQAISAAQGVPNPWLTDEAIGAAAAPTPGAEPAEEDADTAPPADVEPGTPEGKAPAADDAKADDAKAKDAKAKDAKAKDPKAKDPKAKDPKAQAKDAEPKDAKADAPDDAG